MNLEFSISLDADDTDLINSKFKVQSSIFACMICLHDFLDTDDADDADLFLLHPLSC